MEPTVRSGLTVRVLGASIVLALIVGGAFALLVRSISAQREAAVLALQSQEVISSSNRLQRLVLDLETGSRGYLLTSQERFLQPWTTARKSVGPETANLQRLAVAPEEQQQAQQITQAIGSYLNDYSVPLIESARRGDPSARSVATIAEGKRRVDEIRNDFEALGTTERRLASARDASSTATARLAVIAAAAGLGISVVLTLAMAGYLTRAIVRPVRRAARMADQLAGGDLSTRIPETAVGEIRTLEHSFNKMGTSLEHGRDALGRLLREQAALRRVATLVAHGEPPAAVFTAVAKEVGEVLGVDGTRMLRLEADGSATVTSFWGATGLEIPVGQRVSLEGRNVTSLVVGTGAPASLDDFSGAKGSLGGVAKDQGVRLAVGAPILVEGRVWGVMIALSVHTRPPPAQVEQRLAQFTDLVATAIANSQAREDLAASRARLVTTSDQTRRQIERDLHDGTQQRLVSLALDLRNAEAGVPHDQSELRDQLSEIEYGLGAALDDLREISRGIHPAILSEGGLGPALNALARRSAVPVEFTTHITTRLPAGVEVAAYYVVAEALTNATKHANASLVRIKAANPDGRLELSVTDNGVGGADPAQGSGLTGLTDRIEALGGRITVTSPPGEGTRVQIELPTDTG
jgi:signal transduction histidine kinase